MIITMTQHFTAICSEVVGLFYTGMMDLWQFAIRTSSEYKALASMTDPVFLRNDCKGWFVPSTTMFPVLHQHTESAQENTLLLSVREQ